MSHPKFKVSAGVVFKSFYLLFLAIKKDLMLRHRQELRQKSRHKHMKQR